MNIAKAKCQNCGREAAYHRSDLACPVTGDPYHFYSDRIQWKAPPGTTATKLALREVSLNLLEDEAETVAPEPVRPAYTEPVLVTDSAARKEVPIFSGVLNYFPLAIAAVSRLSKRGNDKHNPGQPLHWAREKSTDHEDCIARHLIDAHTLDAVTCEYEDAVALAWRALALLQILEEKRLNKPMSRASS